MARLQRNTRCPLCGLFHLLTRKDPTRVFRYGRGDLENDVFIDWRQSFGHPKEGPKGFKRIKGITIREALAHPETRDTVMDVYEWAKRLIAFIEDAEVENEAGK